MDNYKQKIFLLCALLIGCVLTSIGVEFFTKSDEPIQMPKIVFKEQHIFQNEERTSNIQERVLKNKTAFNIPKKLSKKESTVEKADNENQKIVLPININTASEKELDALPGIGPAIARRIVEHRSSQPFTKIEDIMLVKGIGEKKFAKLKELITRYSISDNATDETLHEEFSYYGVNSDSNLTMYPMCEGLRRFATLTGYGFEDDKGNIVIDAIYHSAQDFIEDRALVESHYGRWGLIDKQGRYIIDMKYDHIEFDVDNGMSEVTLNGHRATFDYFGMQLTPWR